MGLDYDGRSVPSDPEAWAEYVAQVVDPEKTGFPLYGFDEDVVVCGEEGSEIPDELEEELERRHACSLHGPSAGAEPGRGPPRATMAG